MNIYLLLFLTFLEIGAVSFGGGSGMIALMRETTIGYGWLLDEQFLNIIAISESTPGPIAVNIATFVGATQGGFVGALCATIGVILPSFIIIIIISAFISNLLKYAGVKSVIEGMKPAVTGIIFATALTMFLKAIFALDWEGKALNHSTDWALKFLNYFYCQIHF